MVHRTFIIEPNFTSIFQPARPRLPARLLIQISVALVPMDPAVPYHPTRWVRPRLSRFMPSLIAELMATEELNLVFSTHLADSPAQFRRGTVTDGNGLAFRGRSWLRAEFDRYRVRFKQAVEASWNNQLILIPPDDPRDGLTDAEYRDDYIGDPAKPAHVECALQVDLVNANPNAAMQVLRLDRDEPKGFRRQSAIPDPEHGPFRPYAWLITNEDVFPTITRDYRWPSLTFSQVAAAHELGHWLGRPARLGTEERMLMHVEYDKHPKDDPDFAEEQYGTKPGTYGAMMGAGSMVTDYEAAAWLNRMRRHSGALFGWQAIHRIRFQQLNVVPITARQRRLTAGPPPQAPAAPASAPPRPAP